MTTYPIDNEHSVGMCRSVENQTANIIGIPLGMHRSVEKQIVRLFGIPLGMRPKHLNSK